jgi:hypothetical protein
MMTPDERAAQADLDARHAEWLREHANDPPPLPPDACRAPPPPEADIERAAIVAQPPADPFDPAITALETNDGARALVALEDLLAAARAERVSPAAHRKKAADILRSVAGAPKDQRGLAVLKALRLLDGEAGLVLGARPLSKADLSAQLAPIDWIDVALQLGAGRPNMLVGYNGSAKSLLSLHIAVARALDRDILGKFAGQKRRVLVLSKDSTTHAVKGRLQRLARGFGVDPGDLAERLHVVPNPRVCLTDDGAADAYQAAVQGFDLCVIDALRGFVPGVDENDAQIRAYIDPLAEISDASGCAFLMLVHEGKSGGNEGKGKGRGGKPDDEAARGSAGIMDGAGTVWRVLREEHGGASFYALRMAKAPEEPPAPRPEPFYFAIEDVPDEDRRDPRWGLRLTHRTVEDVRGKKSDRIAAKDSDRERSLAKAELDIKRAILNARAPVTTQKDLVALISGGKDLRQDALSRLLVRGEVTGGRGKPFHVTATESVAAPSTPEARPIEGAGLGSETRAIFDDVRDIATGQPLPGFGPRLVG